MPSASAAQLAAAHRAAMAAAAAQRKQQQQAHQAAALAQRQAHQAAVAAQRQAQQAAQTANRQARQQAAAAAQAARQAARAARRGNAAVTPNPNASPDSEAGYLALHPPAAMPADNTMPDLSGTAAGNASDGTPAGATSPASASSSGGSGFLSNLSTPAKIGLAVGGAALLFVYVKYRAITAPIRHVNRVIGAGRNLARAVKG